VAAIALAARIFGAEGVLYSEQSTIGDLLRQPTAPQPYAAISAALWCLALMIPLNFVLHGAVMLLQQDESLSDTMQYWMGPVSSLLLFGALPGLFAWRGRVRLTSGFAMVAAPWPALIGAVVLGLSLWPLVLWPMSFLPEDTLLGRNPERVRQVIEFYHRLSAPEKVLLVVVPALLEEWFFRGYLYGALRQHLGAAATVVVTGLLFGMAHWILNMEMGFSRQLPSFAMGLALGAVREASGSVFPGMLMHSCYNAFVIQLLPESSGQEITMEPWWLLAGAAGSAVGAGFVWWGRARISTGETVPADSRTIPS